MRITQVQQHQRARIIGPGPRGICATSDVAVAAGRLTDAGPHQTWQ